MHMFWNCYDSLLTELLVLKKGLNFAVTPKRKEVPVVDIITATEVATTGLDSSGKGNKLRAKVFNILERNDSRPITSQNRKERVSKTSRKMSP